MNDKALQHKIHKKIDQYAHLLGISDYKFIVNLVDLGELKKRDPLLGSYAVITIYEETREAEIDINKKLVVKRPRELDRTLIHELLHVRLNEEMEFINVLLKRYIKDSKARKTYRHQLEKLEHKVIVALTDALLKRKKWQK